MSNVIISCQQLGKRFQEGRLDVEVLRGVNFQVEAGEKIAILGSSGSGKSTLLHLMGGLDLPSSGHVEVMGKRMDQLSDNARGDLRNESLGFIYQFHHLLPEFTALENVAMPLLIRGVKVAEARQQAADILEKVGLKDRVDHKPAQLSGGERQRAAIARALVTRPKAVLADEPTGNLDSHSSADVIRILEELNAQGITLIVVTHDTDMGERARRKIRMVDGRIVQDGT